MEKLVSVVIVTYNSGGHIYDCLDRLYSYNDIGDALEVLVVDNCSKGFDDMKSKILQIYGGRVRVIQNNVNGGYGQGNNVGIRHSTAPYILIMNPDVRICSPIFKSAYEIFKSNMNIAQIGMKQLLAGQKRGYSFSWKSTIMPYISLPLISITKTLNIFLPKYMYFAGSCFFLRKSTFERIGMFDENIFMYHEEEDIHLRLRQLPNAKLVYWDKGVYEHLHLPSKIVTDNNFVEKRRSLESLKYLYRREGLGEELAYKREIQKNKLMLCREKLLCLIGKGNNGYRDYLNKWHELLETRNV